MSGYLRPAERVDGLRVLAHLVEVLARRFQVAGVQALQAEEDVDAPRAPRFGNEVLDLPGEHVHLHHEFHRDMLLLAQADKSVEYSFPVLVAGEIIVSEEIESYV